MTNTKLTRFTKPGVLIRIGLPPLSRFFDRFRDDLLAANCRLPSTEPGSDAYYNCWAELLGRPETLPHSLVDALLAIEDLAAPANWPRLEAAVYAARPRGLLLDTTACPESLALQLWLWSPYEREPGPVPQATALPLQPDTPPLLLGRPVLHSVTAERGGEGRPVPRSSTAEDGGEESPSLNQPSPPPLPPAAPPLLLGRGEGRPVLRSSTAEDGGEESPALNQPSTPQPSTNNDKETSGVRSRSLDQPNTRAKSVGKISRLPRDIREQLNRRLQNDHDAKTLLDWLNALPEVQSVLAAEFEGRPISKQNLSEWKQHGFRDWQMRQSALQFAQNLDADSAALPQSLAGPLTEKLAHWIALRYAAAAHALAALDDDPETELRRLREFCGDIVALRRGDISAGRLGVAQGRLAVLQAEADAQKEKEFWTWTQRPDIQEKLYPKRDPDQIRRDVVRMLDEELLGIRHPASEPDSDPAILI